MIEAVETISPKIASVNSGNINAQFGLSIVGDFSVVSSIKPEK